MPKRQDLLGQTFGHLTVIAFDEEKTNKTKRSHWICECDCEDKIQLSVMASNLKRGNSTKCKYCRAENLLGKKFNHLTVVKRIIDKNDRVMWECECDCENHTHIIVRGDSLRSNHTQSCGCIQRQFVSQLNVKDLTGQKIGKLTIKRKSERKDNNGNYYYWCDCDCGTKNIEISGRSLTTKKTYSCGCVKSKGEERIANILSRNNINFKREYTILDYTLSTGGHPRFDFAIFDDDKLLYFIEYQGEQHFKSRGNIFTEEKVKIIQQRDKEKKEYCEKNNIKLIYINYTDFNLLDDDFLLSNI